MSGQRTVLVTRPRAEAEALARRIEACGNAALIEPLMEIRFLPDVAVDLAGVRALAFTSANGVRALIHALPHAPDTGLPVFAVGDATARAARAAGFARVTTGGGDVESLARTIAHDADASAGAILHVAGRERAGDLIALLSVAGLPARRVVLYAAETVMELSPATRTALAAGKVDDIVIFSPRTARQFVTLIRRADLMHAAARLRLVALSARVAKAASDLHFASVAVAPRPEQDALIGLLADPPDTGNERR